jgi:CheY-like chemotaxis protein
MHRVLIADDNESFRRAARALLTGDGLGAVEEAATGEETLRLVRHGRPDLVLLDVMLGEDDGRTIAAALLGLPDPPRILLMSARAAEDLDLWPDRVAGAATRPPFVTKTALCPEIVREALAA